MLEFSILLHHLLSREGHDGGPYIAALDLKELVSLIKSVGATRNHEWKALDYIADYHAKSGLAPSLTTLNDWIITHPHEPGCPKHHFHETELKNLNSVLISPATTKTYLPSDMPGLVQLYREALQRDGVSQAMIGTLEGMKMGLGSKAIQDGISSLQGIIPQEVNLTHRVNDEDVEVARTQYAEALIRRSEVSPCFTGIHNIDSAVRGFEPGELVGILGATNHGKSMLALNWAYHNLVAGNTGCYISLEMSSAYCMSRLYAIHSHCPRFSGIHPPIGPDRIHKTELTEDEEEFLFGVVIPDFRDLPGKLHVVDSVEAMNIQSLETLLRRLDQEQALSWFVLDHPDLLEKPAHRHLSSFQNTALLYSSLKQLCAKFGGRGIVGFIPVQANAEGVKKAEKVEGEYTIEAIAGTAEVGRSCTQVYAIWSDPILKEVGECLIQCLKNRNGPLVPRFRMGVSSISGRVTALAPMELPKFDFSKFLL